MDKKFRKFNNRTPINVRELKKHVKFLDYTKSPKNKIRINSVTNRNDYEEILLPPIYMK